MAARRALVAGTTSMLAEINGSDNLEVATGGVISSSGALVLAGANNIVQIPGTDTLDVSTIDRAGTIDIGVTSGTAIQIGRPTQTTTIGGNLQVDGNETITGTSTFVDDATFNGDVQFGDGTGTDLVEFHTATRVGTPTYPNITLSNDTDHDIFVATSANETVGRGLDVIAGTGGASAGGAAGGAGGKAQVTGGTGGAGDATNAAGAGGDAWVVAGSAGTAAAGGGAGGGTGYLAGGAGTGAGNGGNVTIEGGYGDPAGTGNAGGVQIDGGQSTGGNGGIVQVQGGYGNGTAGGGRLDLFGGSTDNGTAAQIRMYGGYSSAGVGGGIDMRAGTGATAGNIVIGANDTAQVQLGAAAAPVVVNGVLQGPNDGTGVVLGHAGTGASTGSAPQLVSLTTTEKGYLVPAAGMLVWDSTLTQFQWYDGTSWNQVGTAGSAGGWTDDGAIVRLTTAGDDVAIGIATMLDTEKLRVIGDVGIQGNVDFENGAARVLQVNAAAADNPGHNLSLIGGDGGTTTGATGQDGGFAYVQGGDGGAGTVTAISGNGGDAVITGGVPGADGGSGQGVNGSVQIGTSQTISVTIGSATTNTVVNIPDNALSRFLVRESTNEYIAVDTVNGSESVEFGNATTNPTTKFLGTGTVSLEGAGQKLALVSDGYIGIDERASGPTTGVDEGALYTKLANGETALFFRTESSGTEYQLTPTQAANPEYVGTAGEALNAGDVVCLQWDSGNTDVRVYQCDANVTARSNGIGITKAAATAGNPVTVQMAGESAVLADARWDTVPGTAQVGLPVWMSETAGQMTYTKPTTGGVTQQQIGWVAEQGTGASTILIDTSVQLRVA